MNTEIAVHPKLHHYGLITAQLDPMVEWYRKALGMTINHRSKIPAIARMTRQGPPFSALAFISNDEMDHRIVLFEIPKASVDPNRLLHTGLQHVAFECTTVDDLLGTYVRLKMAGIPLTWAADHGPGISLYYQDPDRNVVEMFCYNFGSPWTATEYLREGEAGRPAQVDPEKLVEARRAGASPWDLHQRAQAGEFAPAKAYDPATSF